MRNPDRIEPFLQKLGELWKYLPDYRFGQLIYRLANELGQDIHFPEEDVWLEKINKLIVELEEYERNNPKVEITQSDLYDLISKMYDERNKSNY
ncbi:MAG TPA: hypothetical protein VFC79_12445 [Tissierellaceae bacterium]|nr:hypothetical protein [Tissierellaceae bacterium]